MVDPGLPRTEYACTLDEIADALGVSKQRVFEIEQRALKKFRARLMIRLQQMGLTPADLLEIGEKASNAGQSSLSWLK